MSNFLRGMFGVALVLVLGAALVTYWNHTREITVVTRYVVYRADGTLESAKVELQRGPARWHQTNYAPDGVTVLTEQWLDAGRNRLFELNQQEHTYTTFRTDGHTPRKVYAFSRDSEQTFKKNGEVWWERNGATGSVFFDWSGNAVHETFRITNLSPAGYSLKHGNPPIPVADHVWLRNDDTAAYKQTWYAMVDDSRTAFEGLGHIEIYAGDGKTVRTRIVLKVQMRKHGVFVTKVELLNPEGTKLVRTYRAPGNRESEETFDAAGKSVKREKFDKSDRFTESFDSFMFEGFGLLNMFDTGDAHDI